jgi:hypothetical protein
MTVAVGQDFPSFLETSGNAVAVRSCGPFLGCQRDPRRTTRDALKVRRMVRVGHAECFTHPRQPRRGHPEINKRKENQHGDPRIPARHPTQESSANIGALLWCEGPFVPPRGERVSIVLGAKRQPLERNDELRKQHQSSHMFTRT